MERKYSLHEVDNLIEKLKKKKGLKSKRIQNNSNINNEYKEKGKKIISINENNSINNLKENLINKKIEISIKEKTKIDLKNIDNRIKSYNNEKNINDKKCGILKHSNTIDLNIKEKQNLQSDLTNLLNKKKKLNVYGIDNNGDLKNINDDSNINFHIPILNPQILKINNNNNNKNNLNNRNKEDININEISSINNSCIHTDNYKYNIGKNLYKNDINQKNKDKISLLKNIYDSFSHSIKLKNKENVFDTNIINEELDMLGLDFEQSLRRKNIIITNNNLLNNIFNE